MRDRPPSRPSIPAESAGLRAHLKATLLWLPLVLAAVAALGGGVEAGRYLCGGLDEARSDIQQHTEKITTLDAASRAHALQLELLRTGHAETQRVLPTIAADLKGISLRMERAETSAHAQTKAVEEIRADVRALIGRRPGNGR